MAEDEPTIQDLLIDHLRRIIEYWGYGSVEGGKREWFFGVGDDRLMSYLDMPESSLPDDVRASMAMSAIGVEARDRMGNPRATKALRSLYEIICDEDTKSFREFMEELLPSHADTETLQQAYAYEMLKKLDDMVERSRNAVQKMHLLEKVPDSVDRYMEEAAFCFRYGFDLATLSLCRAALEEMLKQEIPRKLGPKGLKYLDKEKNGEVDASLWLLIERASTPMARIIPPQLGETAHDIREAGNDCVHGKLEEEEAKRAAIYVLEKTRLILSQVYQQKA